MTDSVHELAYLYAIDALHDDERTRFEAHLGTCRRCQAEIQQTVRAVAALAEDVNEAPPPGLKDAVMREIDMTPPENPAATVVGPRQDRLDRLHRVGVFAVAVIAILIVGLGLALLLSNDDASVTAVMEAPDAVVVLLEGDSNSIQAVWSSDRGVVALIANGLGRVSSDRTYELWFLHEDRVQPAALFQPDSDGELEVVLEVDDAIPIGFEVTIEPAGGSDQPTSEVIFAGTFSDGEPRS